MNESEIAKATRPGPVPFTSVRRLFDLDVLVAAIATLKTEIAVLEAKESPDADELEANRLILGQWEQKIASLRADTVTGEVHRFTVADHWDTNAFMAERESNCRESSPVARSRYLADCKVRYFAHKVLKYPDTDGKVPMFPAEVVPTLDLALCNAVFQAHVEAFGNPFEPIPKATATR